MLNFEDRIIFEFKSDTENLTCELIAFPGFYYTTIVAFLKNMPPDHICSLAKNLLQKYNLKQDRLVLINLTREKKIDNSAQLVWINKFNHIILEWNKDNFIYIGSKDITQKEVDQYLDMCYF